MRMPRGIPRVPSPLHGLKRPPSITGKLPGMTPNKGSQQVQLPNRAALHQLVGGNPAQQSLGNYAKLTPSGATAVAQPYNDIVDQAQQSGVSVLPSDE